MKIRYNTSQYIYCNRSPITSREWIEPFFVICFRMIFCCVNIPHGCPLWTPGLSEKASMNAIIRYPPFSINLAIQSKPKKYHDLYKIDTNTQNARASLTTFLPMSTSRCRVAMHKKWNSIIILVQSNRRTYELPHCVASGLCFSWQSPGLCPIIQRKWSACWTVPELSVEYK